RTSSIHYSRLMLATIRSLLNGSKQLSEIHRRMYQAEATENFRWAARLLARRSPYQLKSSDLVSVSVQNELAAIGQFAEVAHGQVKPDFIWKYMKQMSEVDYPLHGYT